MEGLIEKLEVAKYPVYKDSGVEWLGEIPEHWVVNRLKYVFKIKKEISGELGHNVLSITQKGIKIKDTESGEGQLSMDYSKYQKVSKGDFGMNHMDLLTGYVDISKFDGVMSPDYRVFESIDLNSEKNYLLNILQLCYSRKIFYAYGQGVSMLGRWRFPTENFNNFYFPIPPKEEQFAISEFLERKTTLIDQAFAIKQKQIELLKERRQILIHKAVTRGLKPNVKLKDSGVEWIGEIPEHWEVSRLGFLTFKIGDGLHGTPNYTDGTNFYFINGNNLSTGNIEISEQTKTVSEKDYLLHKKNLTNKTLLLSINGTIGNVAFYCGEKVILGKSAAYLNFYSDINIEFIKWFLESWVFKNYYEMQLSGSTINNFSLYSIGKTPVIIPPKNEQNKISEYLKISTKKVDNSIYLKEQEIEKLKEYKATVINSAVTGKIKVTGV